MHRLLMCVVLTCMAAVPAVAQPATPVAYVVTFPEPAHHWLQVDVTFRDIGPGPLRARMSRSSPGRYAVHEFAKNIFSIEAYDGRGQRLAAERSGADDWRVTGHDGTVRLVYKIFGDFPDGTYMAVDTTHAHLNMPATFMWAEGLESRPVRITFVPPDGANWRVGTQLFPSANPFAFSAPNLQYFMDSPTELADFLESTFTVSNRDGSSARIRLLVHSAASQADVDALATSVERLVREQVAVFGELPKFDTGEYTFLLDYVPWGEEDGMEHRNSTSISSPGVSLGTPQGRARALGTISHEFFHAWNVERIRPAGLEPFDFTRENVTCCLWLAEGFTQYYGPLLLRRAGLADQVPTSAAVAVINGPGRAVRSAVEMSEHAPFADAGVANDLDDRYRTFISYYTHGAAIALALDLSLRERSGGTMTLDDFMKRLWVTYGAPADARTGYVARPYSLADLRRELAAVSGDRAFTDAFFDRYIEGRDVADYARLLGLAGYVLRPIAPGRAWMGDVSVRQLPDGVLVGSSGPSGRMDPVPFATPAYQAGIDQGDLIVSIDGRPATMMAWFALGEKAPGTRVTFQVRRRDGKVVTTSALLQADPSLRVISVGMTPAQSAFRSAWLGSKATGAGR